MCCGKTKSKAEKDTYQKGILERYSPVEVDPENKEEVEMQELFVKTGKRGNKRKMPIQKVSNMFKAYYEIAEKKYRKINPNAPVCMAFPEDSEYGLCKNLCVTKDNPAFTVSDKGAIVPIPKPKTKAKAEKTTEDTTKS